MIAWGKALRSRMVVRVAVVSAILGVDGCRDAPTAAAPAPIFSLTAVSDLNQQGTVNQFVRSNPTVRVTDAAGHAVAGVSVVFTAYNNGSTTMPTGPDGTASFAWRLTTVAGTQEVAAAISSNDPSVRFTTIALPDSLAAIHAASATSQMGVESEAPLSLPAVVAVDQFNNSKPGAVVTFEVGSAGGVASATVVTDSTGQATAAWTLGASVGTDSLTARAPNVTSVLFTAAVVAPFAATSVVSGAAHSCAIAFSGDVYCWGQNDSGQVNPASAFRSFPVPQRVPLPAKLVGLSAINDHTCGISNESPPQAYCWGVNSSGQLGVSPSTIVATAPVKVPVAEGLAAVTTGAQHTCALTPDGVAYCWGDDNFGQLGTADTLTCNRSDLGVEPTFTCSGPRRVATDQRFIALAAGGWHTCGLTAVGQLYCWGIDAFGELGFATQSACLAYFPQFDENDPVPCALTPRLVTGSPTFAAVAGNANEICGLIASGSVSCYGMQTGTVNLPASGPFNRLTSDGNCGVAADLKAFCWNPSFDARDATIASPKSIGGGRTFAALSGGLGMALFDGPLVSPSSHRCGLLASNSAVVCWGANQFGQLGNGTTTASDVPKAVIFP